MIEKKQMKFIEAVRVFLLTLFGREACPHPRINLVEAPSLCQDCGYHVSVEWLLLQCRRCHAKRTPYRTFIGEIKPVQPLCRHCGYEDYRLVKKPQIQAFEVLYALMEKVTLYSEALDKMPPITGAPKTTVPLDNGDVFEAEVVRKSEFRGARSAFKRAPYDWQTRQNPKRYGAVSNTIKKPEET